MASTPSTSPNGLDPARTGLEPIIREIEDRKSGRSPYNFQPWLVFSLTPADLRALDNHFQGDLFWETKLRSDYFGSSQQFVLRMVSIPHEVVRGELEFKLRSLLCALPVQEASARFAQEIDGHGSATVYSAVGAPYSRHDPDISFGHPAAYYPGMIVEIADSQKLGALEQLANDYICGSNGQIRIVIGVKMEFPVKKGEKGKKATFSVWKPQWTPQDGKQSVHAACTADETFRNEDGTPNLDAELSFSLSDFAPHVVLDRFDGFVDHTLRISAKDLCEYLERAEQYETQLH